MLVWLGLLTFAVAAALALALKRSCRFDARAEPVGERAAFEEPPFTKSVIDLHPGPGVALETKEWTL
ncbi:MAG TPA: hypothetical protein VNN77_19655 [candidate division Zixibacteria bacterium]|nr:hypothetical protein [candidate division Zixibacteria bacterium]